MSNINERGGVGGILMREFAEYAGALTEAGYDWSTTWAFDTWPAESRLGWLNALFRLARECAGVSGVRVSDAEITRLYRDMQTYWEMFPDRRPGFSPE